MIYNAAMKEQVKEKINMITCEINDINEQIVSLNSKEIELEKEIKENEQRVKRENYLPNLIGCSIFGWLSVVSPSLFLKCFFLGLNISSFCKVINKIRKNDIIDKKETEKAIVLFSKKAQLMQNTSKRDNISQRRFILMDQLEMTKKEMQI